MQDDHQTSLLLLLPLPVSPLVNVADFVSALTFGSFVCLVSSCIGRMSYCAYLEHGAS